ncbi:MAG: HNH endonuclease [Planctomycetota bacterium]|jgi:5-methylcytosine-specific restriction endonuclease McrA
MSALGERALVLNRSWTAITTTTVRHALVLAYRQVAQIICPDTYQAYDFHDWAELSRLTDGPAIFTPFLRIRVPEIIVLKRYNGFPRRGVAFSRRNIYRRDAYTCQYCGARPGSELLSIDHVVPRSEGGKSTWENCALACLECNKKKANRTVDGSGLHLRRKPFRPTWRGALEISLGRRKASWEKFISESYWNVELVE